MTTRSSPRCSTSSASRVASEIKQPFDEGIGFLTRGDYPKAEASFKKAISPDGDSTVPLVYLAAAFAAAGRNLEAASAWQTALIDGSDYPQVYQWLGDALMRERDLGAARTILEEAVGKWPTDPRFTKPLALLYGTFGRGREAVRTLERYISEREDDRDAYYMAVQWIYTVHSEGAVVHGRAEDAQARASVRGPLRKGRRSAAAARQAVGRLPGANNGADYFMHGPWAAPCIIS